MEDIITKLENKYNINFKIGIGRVRGDQDIMISYQEALKALNYADEVKITHIDDIAPNTSDVGFEIFAEEQGLIKEIEKGDAQICLNILTDIFNKYTNIFVLENLRNRLIEIMVVAHRIAIENGIKNDGCIEYSKYINQILKYSTQQEFEQMCIEKVIYIASKIKMTKKNTIGIVVDKANKITNERFSQELTLDNISKELCISPQYFLVNYIKMKWMLIL